MTTRAPSAPAWVGIMSEQQMTRLALEHGLSPTDMTRVIGILKDKHGETTLEGIEANLSTMTFGEVAENKARLWAEDVARMDAEDEARMDAQNEGDNKRATTKRKHLHCGVNLHAALKERAARKRITIRQLTDDILINAVMPDPPDYNDPAPQGVPTNQQTIERVAAAMWEAGRSWAMVQEPGSKFDQYDQQQAIRQALAQALRGTR